MRWTVGLAAALLLVVSAWAEDPAPKTPDPLLGLRDPSPRRRIEAAWKLADLRTPKAQGAWVAALRDPARPELHFEAGARLAAFEKLGQEAREALEAALTCDDRAVRLAASVALRRTADHQGPIDSMRRSQLGEECFGVPATRRPVDGFPTTFDAASLDATLWTGLTPINILGEGTVTYVTLLRIGDDMLARTARASHRLVRNPPSTGTKSPRRRWTTDWSLATGWIEVAAHRWSGGRASAREGPMLVGTSESAVVGVVLGRLVTPALLRSTTDTWTFTGRYDALTFRFGAALVAGKSGAVDVTIKPRKGAGVVGTVRWRVDKERNEPILRIGTSMATKGGPRKISPREFLIDTTTGAAAAVGRRIDASAMYAFAGRMPPTTKPR